MEVSDSAKAAAFRSLQPLCSRIMELPTQGIQSQSAAIALLQPLHNILQEIPANALQFCADYAMFPLLLLIDAAVALRAKNNLPGMNNTVVVSDKLAEGVVSCLEVLLQKCPVRDTEQMTMLMRKLVGAALLKPEEASEEFRHGIIKCIKAMFEQLTECEEPQCSCRTQEKSHAVNQNCVLSVLRSEDMAGRIGHLFSLLLQISHVEAAKAGVGSGTIRADSLSTLRVVMRKVCTPDALAFFLPGIASGLGKTIKSALLTKKRSAFMFDTVQFYSVGAAGNSRALEEAIHAITELFSYVLADVHYSSKETQNLDSALETLKQLARKRPIQNEMEIEGHSRSSKKEIMRVERNERWLEETVIHVNTLFSDVFPSLCAHPTAAVRIAAGEAAGSISQSCQEMLRTTVPLLLETLLVLACDDANAVSAVATCYLSEMNLKNTNSEAFIDVLNRLLEDLPRVIVTASELTVLMHARRLAAAMYFAGPERVFTCIFQSPACVSRFVSTMTQSLSLPSAYSSSTGDITPRSYRLTEYSDSTVESLPKPAPWFAEAGKTGLYEAFATVIRLAGFSSLAGCSGRKTLTDILSLLQMSIRDCATTSSSNYMLTRAAASAACVLNEVVYGASGAWPNEKLSLFHTVDKRWSPKVDSLLPYVIDSVGYVLHDYMLSEIWELPIDSEYTSEHSNTSMVHSLQDNAALQQMLIEGIGIFAVALGKAFDENGYLGLVIYPLLEKLGCGRDSLSHAANISLRAISRSCGYDSVKELVVANLDHIVDSLCRQLRHISIYPHAPDLLTAILQQTGAATDLLPLLEEPMRGLLLELEIPGRHHHPQFTIPILKALREITKAARHGSFELMEAGSALPLDKEGRIQRLLQIKRCQLSVLTVATSCTSSSAPLLASKNIYARILTLDIIEQGMAALSKIEPTVKDNMKRLEETLCEGDEDEEMVPEPSNDGNKLLPTMHQIWPHLVNCLKHNHPAVVVRCLEVIAILANECGGDFLARRFKEALPLFLKLLKDGPSTQAPRLDQIVSMRPNVGQDLENQLSPAAIIKVQEAVLKCFRVISESKRSRRALDLVMDTVVSWVVGLACSQATELRQQAVDTAVSLSEVDGDFVWGLAADLAYGDGSEYSFEQPPSKEFPRLSEILRPYASIHNSLCSQYVGKDFKYKLDHRRARELVTKLEKPRTIRR